MAHCPGCGNTVSTAQDVTFTEMNEDEGLSITFGMDSSYFIMSCGQCNRMLGGGVGSYGAGS